jgi:hypothetical protein
MARPKLPRIWVLTGYILAGLFLLGELLDVISNSINLITLKVSILGTFFISLTWLTLELAIKRGWLSMYIGNDANAKLTGWGKRPRLFIFGIVLGLWIPLFTHPPDPLGPVKEKQDQLISGQSRAEEKMDDIKRLMESLGDRYSREKLLTKYPLGYVIFEIDHTNAVFPYDRQLIDKYNLDWSHVGITKSTENLIELRLPDIKTKDGKPILTNNLTGGPKRIGNMGGGAVEEMMFWGEILDIKKTGIVFLVGFQKTPEGVFGN